MPKPYAMIKSGTVQTVIMADGDLSSQLGYDLAIDVSGMSPMPSPGYTWDGSTFTSGPAPSFNPSYGSRVTPLAFRQRFTNAETVAIYAAAKSIDQIQVYLDTLTLARYVDLADQQTDTDLQGLVAAGLLVDARRLVILSTPVAQKEMP